MKEELTTRGDDSQYAVPLATAMATRGDSDSRGARMLARFFQSQQEVAPRLGIKPSQLSLLIAGKRRPSIEVAAAIEREFGVPCIAWCEEPMLPSAGEAQSESPGRMVNERKSQS